MKSNGDYRKRNQRVLAVLCVLVCLFSLPSTGKASSFENTVRTTFKKYKTSGGMVLAAKDGQIVYQYCYGWANKQTRELVSPDTYFKLASVSKLVTAVSVMRLVETGKLSLDENVGAILGEPAFYAASSRYAKTGITSRMLMTHTACINDSKGAFTNGKPLTETLNPKKNKNASGFIDKKPGTYYKYSNFGAGIMGCVVEATTGKRLTDAAKELVFNDMDIDAAYDPHLLQNPEKIVSTYRANGDLHITRSYRLKLPYRETVNIDKDYNDSYGGLWIRGEDLCKIGIMLCDLGEYEGKQILQEETVLEMISSQKNKGGIVVDSPYGLNVERVTNLLDGKTLYGHQGLSEGVLCSLYFDPQTHFVFALLTNGCNVKSKQDHICLLARKMFEIMWTAYAN